jgi:acetoin utilization deacetylase AcuC-like enzyme
VGSEPDRRVLVGSLDGVDGHDSGPGHPESPSRLVAAMAGVVDAELGDALVPLDGRDATFDELARVHGRRHLEALASFCRAGGGRIDVDTVAGPGSWDTAVRAAGTGLAAVEALRRGEGEAAFVACRPPGHHATPDRSMGFCLLNNAAVVAASLVAEGERVLVVDWDVHHGNGTQEAFWDDPSVLYVSTHQDPSYPGTGAAAETGGPGAPGLVVNVPLPPGATGDVALLALDEVAAPAVERFDPTWVLVSAGFDAHRDDPLADLAWSAGDYAELATRVAAWAPAPGRVVALLEGGYDLGALRRSVAATVSALAGALAGAPQATEPPTSGGPGRTQVLAQAQARARLS